MTAKDAYRIFRSKWGNIPCHKCVEYKTMFVLWLGSSSNSLLGGASVDKQTGVVQKFMPTDIPLAEYRAGKEVKAFK